MSASKTPAVKAASRLRRAAKTLVKAILPQPTKPIVTASQAAASIGAQEARPKDGGKAAKKTPVASTVGGPAPQSRSRGQRRRERQEAEQQRQAKARERQQRQRQERQRQRAAAEAKEQAEAQAKLDGIPVVHAHAAGIDVGDATHWVCVERTPASAEREVREFSAMTHGLRALVAWLRECGVTTVALEATGIYSHILYLTLLEAGFPVVMVSPQFTRQIKGRPKTDKRDCQWIQRLHAHGLLPSVFQPDEATQTLRDYVRQRANHVRLSAQHVQRMQKALALMNLKLTKVLRDITGMTGLKIVRAILRGQRDPQKLAELRDPRCKHTKKEIALALDGRYRPEHLLELELSLQMWEQYQRVIAKLDRAIEQQLRQMKSDVKLPPLPPKRQRPRPGAHQPHFDVRLALYYLTGVDLTLIEGIDALNGLTILSEIGTDMTKWPTVKHFCSWLGLCPNWKKTGGKVRSSHTRRGKNRAATALRMAAYSLIRSRTYLGAYVRRQRARLGAPKAITAGAHKLATIIYNLLRYGWEYTQKTEAEYAALTRARQLKALFRNARELGFELKEIEAAAKDRAEAATSKA
jgi:transposase